MQYTDVEFTAREKTMTTRAKKSSAQKRKWVIRVISIFLALLIVGSTLAALFYL